MSAEYPAGSVFKRSNFGQDIRRRRVGRAFCGRLFDSTFFVR